MLTRPELRTLPETLAEVAGDPTTGSIVHVLPDGSEAAETYAELREDALRAAASLRRGGVRPGDRVVIAAAGSQAVLNAFWGCVLAGAVPAVLTAPAGLGQATETTLRFRHVWEQLQRPPVIAGSALLAEMAAVFGLSTTDARLLAAEALTAADPDAEVHAPALDDLALLQFSSGSTGAPKGVRLTHRNLAVNIGDCAARGRMDRSDVFCNWMPHSHDMGLIGFHLLPLTIGCSQVTITPFHFMRSPEIWFEKIAAHGATFVGCTNFALEYLRQRVLTRRRSRLDLSSVRLLCVGAEPIAPATVRAFLAAAVDLGLDPHAIFPAYGMAEATAGVLLPAPGEGLVTVHLRRDALRRGVAEVVPPDGPDSPDRAAVEFVVLGSPLDSVELRVTDTDGAALPDGSLGHVQVRGPNVASRYESDGQPLLREDGWLDTGDLGVRLEDRLVVTGRFKDVIFLNGAKLHAEDIESRAAEALGLRADQVVACGYSDEVTGLDRVAVFVKGRRGALDGAYLDDLRARIFKTSGVWPDQVIPVPSIPKTTSGKIQRFKLREMLTATLTPR